MNSIEGIGSQFKVIIPVKIGEEKNELEKDSTKSSFDCRLLLVEYVPTNQIVAKLMLEKIGCSVQVASNGKQGLAMLDAGEFDIVLMDIQMPVMDGIEATKEIRKGKHKDIKILGLSANALMQEVSYYKSIGMDEFMSKPISLNKLLKAFRKLES